MDEVIKEYFELDHAELVPITDLNKPQSQVFYFPIHVIQKESSATTKVRTVFDASSKSITNISLDDMLVGPTVYPPLIDVLLRFRLWLQQSTVPPNEEAKSEEKEHFSTLHTGVEAEENF